MSLKRIFQYFLQIFHKKFGSLKLMRTFAIPNEKNGSPNAEIAQLVEHNLAKVGVASSSLVFRSKRVSRNADLNFENNLTRYNYICSRSLTETAFFIVNRSPTHLWQGFVLPTEQKRNKQEAWESRKMKSSKAVSEHWILRRICDQISD